MSKYRVVCIDKDDTYHEAAFEDLYNAKRFVELLKRLLIFDTTDMYSLTVYEDETVVIHEVFDSDVHVVRR